MTSAVGRDERPRRRGGGATRTIVATVITAMLGSSLLIWQATRATYSGTTTNASNSWATGAVSLSDDDSASAMFSVSGIAPGATAQHCIKVTYTGNTATNGVKLYVANYSQTNSLATYLDLTVDEGSGASFASCAGFSASGTIFNGTLAGLSADTDYAHGVGSWTPNANGQTKVYRFTWTFDAAAPNSTQSSTAAADFVWEAQA